MSTNDPVRSALWRDLSEAAKRWAANPKAEEGQALSDAAKAWGMASHPKAKRDTSAEVIPFGRSKGTPVSEADESDLRWVAGALARSIDDPSKARYADDNRRLLDAIEAELETR